MMSTDSHASCVEVFSIKTKAYALVPLKLTCHPCAGAMLIFSVLFRQIAWCDHRGISANFLKRNALADGMARKTDQNRQAL